MLLQNLAKTTKAVSPESYSDLSFSNPYVYSSEDFPLQKNLGGVHCEQIVAGAQPSTA